MTDVDIRTAELVGLKLLRVHEYLDAGNVDLFKQHGLSGPQYNVLRILRGARGQELSCHEIGERMVKRVPDVTRLLDRLEQRRLVARRRCDEDRRVVRTRITEPGLAVLKALDGPLRRKIARDFAQLDGRKLAQLDRLLDRLLPE
jgi:DNA-binding MarR family transcriptional regulator